MRKVILLICFSFSILSCMTNVSVQKVTKENANSVHGIKYSLPKVYIEFKPSEEGGGEYVVTVIYLPDTNQTYAINASTFLGTFKNVVKIKNGLLTQVDLGGASDAVAAEAVKAAGTLISEDLKRKQTKKDEKRKAIKALEDDVEAKKLAHQKAKKKNELNPSTDNKVAEALALLDLEEARRKLAEARGNLGQVVNSPDFVIQAEADLDADAVQDVDANKVWGPMYYEIKDDYDVYKQSGKVELVAVKPWPSPDSGTQKKFDTISVTPTPTPTPTPSPSKLNCEGPGTKSFTLRDGSYQLADETQLIAFTQAIKEVVVITSNITPRVVTETALASNLLNINLRSDKATLEIVINGSVAPGTYDLNITFLEINDSIGSSKCSINLTRN